MPNISEISILIKAQTRQFVKGLRNATKGVMNFTKSITGTLMGALFSLKGLIATVFAGIAVKEFVGSAIQAAASIESLNAQFKVLLGSQDAALQRMKELTAFSAETPFQINDIAKANKIMQSLTDGVLANADGMRMLGDAAAFADQPINELAVHVGRLFSGIKAGTAVGEPLARLQELGILSGEARREIENLMKQGLKGQQVWKVVEQNLSKVSGTMKEMSKTVNGLWSTFKDNLNLALAEFGVILEPLVKFLLKEAIGRMQMLKKNILQIKDAFKNTARVGLAFVKMMEAIGNAIGTMIAGDDINKAFASFETSLIRAFGTVAFFAETIKKSKGKISDELIDIVGIVAVVSKSIASIITENISNTIDKLLLGARFIQRILQAFVKASAGPAFKFGDTFAAEIKKAREELRPEKMKLEKGGVGTLDELKKRIIGDIEKFGVKTKDVIDGPITEVLKKILDGAELEKFLQKWKEGIDRFKFEPKEVDLKANFGADEITENLKELAEVQPKLAKKGSQEAARAEAGVIGVQQKQLSIMNKQLAAQNKTNRLLNEFAKDAPMGVMLPTVDPFGSGVTAGAMLPGGTF